MSRLYYKHMMGEDTIGYYYNGEVYKGNPDGLLGDTHIVLSYNGNNIYKNGELIAFLDDYGNIREWRGWGGAGEALACIQDGKVYLSNGNGWESTLATYDGDIYGAAAAVVAFMLNLGGSQAGGTKTDGSNQGSSSSTTQPGGLGFGVIIELIVGIASTVIVLALGLLILLGLGDRFILGYNTASEQKKTRYILPRLRLVTGISIFVLTAATWLCILLQLSDVTVAIVMGVLVILVVLAQKFYAMK